MNNYTFHGTLEKATIGDYLKLFQRSYGEDAKLTVDYLRWLYEDNPDGRAVGMDAFLDGELAAHYVTIPRTYRVDGTDMIGLLSVNTATHPEHQHRGLFKKLANATYDHGAAKGYNFVVGIANEQSVRGFTKNLEFERLGHVRLAFLHRPPPPHVSEPNLAVGGEWLRWRLSNPSATYFVTQAGGGREIISTRKGPATFLIGNVSLAQLSVASLELPRRALISPAALTPMFPAKGKMPLLPLRLQPSPWHVILRPLSGETAEMRAVRFDGLAMDTF